MNLSMLKASALRDAFWILGFDPATEWEDGEGSGFRPNRLAELKEAGVFLPHPSKPGMLIIGTKEEETK